MGSKHQSSEAPGLWPPRPLLCTPYWIRYEIRRIVTITPYWGSNTAYCATKTHTHTHTHAHPHPHPHPHPHQHPHKEPIPQPRSYGSTCHSTHEKLSLHAIRFATKVIQMRRDI